MLQHIEICKVKPCCDLQRIFIHKHVPMQKASHHCSTHWWCLVISISLTESNGLLQET